ncbi:hypothetical protein ABZ816_30270 [Actinosynnema sp. NPDC047251]|uniref:Uncharacterized protein n=1 Tax=Saccharothrix espanaensis (strain ATCC 51144 / DSM 44229 / JCM 9112 / NBRC 15066 / NRRL 15764) TaxID=1179773 RepID=K0KCZ5_SACES|nr:hypothetical protein [Saccharothrix espanaensis]CCH34634.1 hypothetical protein BN6_74050 [Saccharothrix espanaensis DSM 44229]
MIDSLAVALTVLALVAAAWAVLLVVLDKPLTLETKLTLGVAGLVVLLEVGLLAQAVVGIVKLAGLDREISGATFVGYLLGPVLVLPLAGFWSIAERSRWGASVLAVGCLSVPVMIVRLNQVWLGHA